MKMTMSQSIVYVNTATQLQSALNNAVPGQTIMINDGYYERSGGFYANAGIHGTASNPIKVIGTRNAILSTGNQSSGYSFSLKGNSYWLIKGFTVKNAKNGVVLDRCRYVTVDSILASNVGQSGVHLRTHTSYSIVKNCHIDSTGLDNPAYGEGVYIGSANSNWCTYTNCDPDTSNYNQVLNNTFGTAISAENIDIKEGTKGGLIKGNVFNGTGLQLVNGGDSWVDVKGNYYLIDSNVGNNTVLDGFQTHIQQPGGYGNFNRFANNTINMNAGGYGIRVQTSNANGTATANEVCNTNVVSGSATALSNVPVTSCNPVLPLTILEWNVFLKDNKVVFHWKVSSEENIDFFNIEQSSDGRRFTSLMKVAVAGTDYQKDILSSLSAGNFFRIATRTKDGQIYFSKIFSLENRSGSFNARIENDNLVILNAGRAALIQIVTINGLIVGIERLQQGYNTILLKNRSDVYILNVMNDQQTNFTKAVSRYSY